MKQGSDARRGRQGAATHHAAADALGWSLGRPLAGDRAVAPSGDRLAGRRLALVVCGGIAAYRTPDLCRALRREGAEVVVFCTPSALDFVTATAIEWTALAPPIVRLDGRAAHVESGDVDLWLVAPATYGTINKLAAGVADNGATTALAAALGACERGRTRLLLAPAMHGDMVNSVLVHSLRRLEGLGACVVPPRGGDGKARLPEVVDLVDAVVAALTPP